MAVMPKSTPAPQPPRLADEAAPHGPPKQVEDVIFPHARTEDGAGMHVLRKRGDALELGTLRAAREGQPLHGELVRLAHREGTPLFDVETLHAPAPARGRPAKVASDRFRDGWDRIWGREGSANDAESSRSERTRGKPS